MGGDLRLAARGLWRSKRFFALAVATLAVGIGAACTIYSAADAAVFHPFPALDHPERVVWLTEVDPRSPGEPSDTVGRRNFEDWRQGSRSFEAFTHAWAGPDSMGGTAPVPVEGWQVGADYLRVLGVVPALGRGFVSDDEPATLLTDGLWRRAFGGDPQVIGRSVDLDGRAHTIVGVLRPDFAFYGNPELFVPHRADGERFPVIARLHAGVTLRAAQAELDAISTERHHAERVRLEPVVDYIGAPSLPAIWALFGAVVFVLLIAVTNLASLQLVRGLARRRELAVKQSLGASRARIVRQLLCESLIIAVVAGGLGLALASLGTGALRAGHADRLVRFLPQVGNLRVDARMVAFAVGVVALCALLSGLWPALTVSRLDLQSALKEGGSAGLGARPRRATAALVIAQVALALVLLVAAAATAQSVVGMLVRSPGFAPEGITTLDVVLGTRYPSEAARVQFVDALLARTGGAAATSLPLARQRNWDVSADGTTVNRARATGVSPAFFQTFAIPLLRGRLPAAAEPGALIDRRLATRLFGDADPIGRTLRISGQSPRQIVGLVGDLAQPVDPMSRTSGDVYVPYAQFARGNVSIVARGGVDLRAAVRELDPHLAVGDPISMIDRLGAAHARDRLLVGLMAALAAIALGLATIGLGGVIAYAAEQRTHEIGVRLALGAPRRAILSITLRRGLALAAAGAALGTALAPLALRVVGSFVVLDRALPWLPIVGAPLLVAAAALAASLSPARRALAVSPMIVLRREGP